MSKGYKNKKRDLKLESICADTSLLSEKNDLAKRSKFNFSFLDTSQTNGSDFSDLALQTLCTILNHLKEHGKKSLKELSREGIGKGTGSSRKRSTVLQIYGAFPPNNKTSFREPSYIPLEAKWARIRFGSKARLAGFTVPQDLHGTKHNPSGEIFDSNTFYVVFIDMHHKFYNSRK